MMLMIRSIVVDWVNDDDDFGDVDEYDIDNYKMMIIIMFTCCNIRYVDGTILWW